MRRRPSRPCGWRARRPRPAASVAGAVPHRQAGARLGAGGRSQLFAVGTAGRPGLPHQREARAAGLASGRIHDSVRVGQTIEAAGTARYVHPRRERSGGAGLGRRGHHPGARDALRPRRRLVDAPGVLGPRRPQRERVRIRGRGPPPADDPAQRPMVDLLQLAVVGRRARRSRGHDGASHGRRAWDGSAIAVDADVYFVGPAAFMADLKAAFDRARVRSDAPAHRGVRRARCQHPRHRRQPRRPSPAPRRPSRNGAGGHVRPQWADGSLGRSLRFGAGAGRGVSVRSAGRAGRACATRARRISCRAPWPTSPNRSTCRRSGMSSSAAHSRPRRRRRRSVGGCDAVVPGLRRRRGKARRADAPPVRSIRSRSTSQHLDRDMRTPWRRRGQARSWCTIPTPATSVATRDCDGSFGSEPSHAGRSSRHDRDRESTCSRGRAVVECVAHLVQEGRMCSGRWPSWPSRPTIGRWCSARTAASGRSSDTAPSGHRSSSRRTTHPGDVVGRYQAALDAGDVDRIVSTFAPDGYFREPIGAGRRPPRHSTSSGRSSPRAFAPVASV